MVKQITNPEDMPVIRMFDIWLDDLVKEQGVTTADLILMQRSLLVQLRYAKSYRRVCSIVHGTLLSVESEFQHTTYYPDPRTLKPILTLGRDLMESV